MKPPDVLPFLAAERISNVVIKSDLSEAVEHNSTVVLSCSADGTDPEYTWTNGTKPLISDGKRITLTEVGPLGLELLSPAHPSASKEFDQSGLVGAGLMNPRRIPGDAASLRCSVWLNR